MSQGTLQKKLWQRKLNKSTILHTILLLNIYEVHRDPNSWPNPEIFESNRFFAWENS